MRPRLSSPKVRRRKTAVITSVVLGGWLALGPAGAALADSGDDGEVLAAPLPLGQAALIYGGIPLAIIGLIWLFASIPSMVSAPRYRPGLSWWANPVWFGGPTGDSPLESEPNHEGGGTSARW